MYSAFSMMIGRNPVIENREIDGFCDSEDSVNVCAARWNVD
jgi:hypothetical protein